MVTARVAGVVGKLFSEEVIYGHVSMERSKDAVREPRPRPKRRAAREHARARLRRAASTFVVLDDRERRSRIESRWRGERGAGP